MQAIILCDDELGVLKLLEEAADECISGENLLFYIALSTEKPGEVVKYAESHAGETVIFILDVELKSPLYNGIELGSVIRRACPDSYLIYVSCQEDAALLTFKHELRCFDFISKNEENLKERIRRDLIGIHKELGKRILAQNLIEYNGRIIDTDKLLYIETSKNQHRIEIYQENSFTEVWGSLAAVRRILPESFFFCHRSVIVNVNKINYVSMPDRRVYFRNGKHCDGSVMQLREMKKKYPEIFKQRG